MVAIQATQNAKELSKKPCIAGILDKSDDVSQNVDSYKVNLQSVGGLIPTDW